MVVTRTRPSTVPALNLEGKKKFWVCICRKVKALTSGYPYCDLQNRGVEDILITCCVDSGADRLPGGNKQHLSADRGAVVCDSPDTQLD